jgi:hypothetical protein
MSARLAASMASSAGTYSAFCGPVQLFETLQDGYHTPLTTTQIAGLFQAGCLSRNAGSDLAENTDEQTIDELLPLLKYRTSRQFTRRLPASRRPTPFRLSLPTAIPLVFLGVIATVVVGLFFSARQSIASPVLPSAASRPNRTLTGRSSSPVSLPPRQLRRAHAVSDR